MKERFLQIGLGSMGKRRIRNLLGRGIAAKNIAGFDLSRSRREEAGNNLGIRTFSDFRTAQKIFQPDVYIISTPPDKHHPYFLAAARAKKHFFVEVGTADTGYDKLFKLLGKKFVAAPSCTFRYHPAVKLVKRQVRSGGIGRILSFQYHLGQYLPDWHPWEDYRKVYFASRSTGGCREMFIFELIWLTDLVGAMPKKICGIADKISDLKMTADDVYAAALQFDNKVTGSINIDLLSRSPLRKLRLIGETGILEWSWLDLEIRIFSAKTKKWKTVKAPKNYEEMYHEEMSHFLGAVRGGRKYPYTFAEDHRILKTIYGLEKSSKQAVSI